MLKHLNYYSRGKSRRALKSYECDAMQMTEYSNEIQVLASGKCTFRKKESRYKK